ncbi:MAG: PTS sugar transporter subunit IIA [Desulfovibrio sp.]
MEGLLDKELILSDLQSAKKDSVLEEMVSALVKHMPELESETVQKILLERESLGTTGIGDGVAIPHAKLSTLEEMVLVVGRSTIGVDYEALDDNPCNIFFMVLAPESAAGAHLKLLAAISRLLKNENFRDEFMKAPDGDALFELLKAR